MELPQKEHAWTENDIGTNSILSHLGDTQGSLALFAQKALKGFDPTSFTIPPSNIRKVRYQEFEPYLKSIETVIDGYSLSKALGRGAQEGIPALGSTPDMHDELFNDIPELAKLLQTPQVGPSRAQRTRMMAQNVPLVESVPKLYFDKDFSITSPDTFMKIVDYRDLTTDASASRLLQDNIQNYRDTVEVYLLREISKRSNSFFKALFNLQELHKETEDCVSNLSKLRAQLKNVSDNVVRPGLLMVKKEQQLGHMSVLYKGISQVNDLKATHPFIQIMLGQADYVGALALIEDTLMELNMEKVSTNTLIAPGISLQKAAIDLHSVKCVTNLHSQFIEITHHISLLMSSDLTNTLLDDIKLPVDADLMMHWNSGIAKGSFLYTGKQPVPESTASKQALQARLNPIIFGLYRINKIASSLGNFQTPFLATVGSQLDAKLKDMQDASQKQSRSLSFDAFLEFLQSSFEISLNYIHKSYVQHQIISGITAQAQKAGIQQITIKVPSLTPQLSTLDDITITDSLNLVSSVSNHSHQKCAALMAVRQEQTNRLNLKDYYRLYKLSNEFIYYSEYFSKKQVSPFKQALIVQTTGVINNFHEEKKRQISILLENEQWDLALVPIDFQDITEQLALEQVKRKSRVYDDEGPQSPIESPGDLITSNPLLSSGPPAPPPKKSHDGRDTTTNYLFVDGQKFHVVGSVLIFLNMLTDYMTSAETLNLVSLLVSQKILEILKLFNSKVCQLILGGAAISLAGLKSIGARHISLAAQSLGSIMAVIPLIKSGLMKMCVDLDTSAFNAVIKDYADHQKELFGKLTSIMQERVAAHVGKMLLINWDNPDANDYTEQSAPMQLLVKETQVLYKVISKVLPGEQVKAIMETVTTQYLKQLEDISQVNVYSAAGKSRLVEDAMYFNTQLNLLDLVSVPNHVLETLVASIKIKQKGQQTNAQKPPQTKAFNIGSIYSSRK